MAGGAQDVSMNPMGEVIHDLPNGDRDLLAGGSNTAGKIADDFNMTNFMNLELPEADGDDVMNDTEKAQKDDQYYGKDGEGLNINP